MEAVIFDIDGTLLDSADSGSDLYGEAVRQVLGQVRIRGAWHEYARVSDTGILAEICCDNALAYDEFVSDSVRDAFLARLHMKMSRHGPYQEIPGALDFVRELKSRPDVQIAYATGSWRAPAELKLTSAGFPLQGVPLATANDHQDRQQIMLHALSQLEGPFNSITYFGDGIWDRHATAALGWSFVPVGPKLGGLLDFGRVPPDSRVAQLRRSCEYR